MRTTDVYNTLVYLESVVYERKEKKGQTMTTAFDSGYSFFQIKTFGVVNKV